jgi:BirA family biotin operon repressor/biotin-[acetyl-CoA-carboxylase] ligase
VAGILAEVHQDQRDPDDGRAAVLGIGLNVHQDAGELPVPTATSLRLAGAATTDRDTVLRAVLRALSTGTRPGARPAATRGRAASRRRTASGARRSAPRSRSTCRTAGCSPAVAEGVDDEGRLLVRDAGGASHELAAGDVVHVRPGRRPAGRGRTRRERLPAGCARDLRPNGHDLRMGLPQRLLAEDERLVLVLRRTSRRSSCRSSSSSS